MIVKGAQLQGGGIPTGLTDRLRLRYLETSERKHSALPREARQYRAHEFRNIFMLQIFDKPLT